MGLFYFCVERRRKMNKPKLPKLVESTRAFVSKRSPEILMGIGITGMLTTTVLAVKATPKALMLIEKEQRDRREELSVPEKIKTCWKCYIPATTTCVFSIACLLGSSSVNTRRNAALATAYKISETVLSEYRDKVVETVGEKKEQSIRDKVSKERIDKKPVSKSEVIITKRGDTLCYDTISGRYFKSDIERIKKAENDLNKRMLSGDMYVSLSEFYDELGLDHTAISDDLGWNIDKGMIELDFSSQIADDGTPCIVVDYCIAPRYDFSRFV